MQDRFSEELKSQVVGIYNEYKDRDGVLHQSDTKTSDENCVEMAPPKPHQPINVRKPSDSWKADQEPGRGIREGLEHQQTTP